MERMWFITPQIALKQVQRNIKWQITGCLRTPPAVYPRPGSLPVGKEMNSGEHAADGSACKFDCRNRNGQQRHRYAPDGGRVSPRLYRRT